MGAISAVAGNWRMGVGVQMRPEGSDNGESAERLDLHPPLLTLVHRHFYLLHPRLQIEDFDVDVVRVRPSSGGELERVHNALFLPHPVHKIARLSHLSQTLKLLLVDIG